MKRDNYKFMDFDFRKDISGYCYLFSDKHAKIQSMRYTKQKLRKVLIQNTLTLKNSELVVFNDGL